MSNALPHKGKFIDEVTIGTKQFYKIQNSNLLCVRTHTHAQSEQIMTISNKSANSEFKCRPT